MRTLPLVGVVAAAVLVAVTGCTATPETRQASESTDTPVEVDAAVAKFFPDAKSPRKMFIDEMYGTWHAEGWNDIHLAPSAGPSGERRVDVWDIPGCLQGSFQLNKDITVSDWLLPLGDNGVPGGPRGTEATCYPRSQPPVPFEDATHAALDDRNLLVRFADGRVLEFTPGPSPQAPAADVFPDATGLRPVGDGGEIDGIWNVTAINGNIVDRGDYSTIMMGEMSMLLDSPHQPVGVTDVVAVFTDTCNTPSFSLEIVNTHATATSLPQTTTGCEGEPLQTIALQDVTRVAMDSEGHLWLGTHNGDTYTLART